MNEQLYNEFIALLSDYYGTKDINDIGLLLYKALQNYDVTKKCTEIARIDEYYLPNVVKEYMVTKKMEGNSESTIKNCYFYLKLFFGSVQKPVESVDKADIVLFLHQYKVERNISDRSLENVRDNICRFFNWLTQEGYIEKNPASTIKPIKYEKKERQALTRLEVERLRASCSDERERAIIDFFLATGCRVSEIGIIKKSDIHFDKQGVQLFGKGKKYRTTYLNATAQVSIENYWNNRKDDSDLAFVSARGNALTKETTEKMVKKISSRSGITRKVTPHILRHTFATLALESGMPIECVQIILGHSDIGTTLIYAKSSRTRVEQEYRKNVI